MAVAHSLSFAAAVLVVATGGCKRVASSGAGPAPSDTTASAPAAPVATAPAATSGAAIATASVSRTLRVYVAGESIERRVRWIAPPLRADGRLDEHGADRNADDEYGWVVPFAERLKLRAPGLTVAWVGTDRWLGHDDEPYDGAFPPGGAGATSAISGTSIDAWLEQRRTELEKKKHCYDLAIAARGGNDFENDDDSTAKQISELVHLLAHGSSCKPAPLVVVTGHMPDDQRGGKGPSDAAYVAKQKHQFVERFRASVESLRKEQIRVRFADLYTPFIENRRTTAFPNETWSTNGVPDYAKIGREGDRMHPRRLASIYAGEIFADAIDLTEL